MPSLDFDVQEKSVCGISSKIDCSLDSFAVVPKHFSFLSVRLEMVIYK